LNGIAYFESPGNVGIICVRSRVSIVKGVHDVTESFFESLLFREALDEFSGFSDDISAIGFSGSFDALLSLGSHEVFLVKRSVVFGELKKTKKAK
jgi:hypothetical protein